jgi:DNA gyrase/topoisomerase IV subunit B
MSRHSIKDDRWHVLNRTGMYLGSTVRSEIVEYLIVDGIFKQYLTSYVPALVKMANEIIDNSVDILKDSKKGTLDVIMNPDNNQIMVKDNGGGIPVKEIENLDGTHILIPKACWSIAKSGSNFNDDSGDATTIGTNGVGSFCTNVLSKKFVGITNDGNKKYSGTWTDNCSADSYVETISEPTGEKGTSVYFEPDLERLGIKNFNDDTLRIIKQRLINLSVTYPNIKFSFNSEPVSITQKEFMNMLGSHGNIYTDKSGKYSYAVYPSVSGDFETFSIVNGLNIKDGTHIDYLLKYITSEIKEKLPKKFDKISVGDIKNKIKIVFIGRDFPTIQWSGQTKETIGNSNKDIRAYLGEDWKDLLKEIAKNKEIIEPITFLHAAKLDAEEKKLAAGADKELKKAKVLKIRHASKQKKFLMLTEGDSALKGIIKALGRLLNGFLPLRGVVANPYTNTIQKIVGNAEYKDIMNILGLNFSKANSCLSMNYEYVVLTTDADVDGAHIQGLLMGFFYKFVPDIFEHKKILILRTPIKVAKDKKENMIAAFITEQEYTDFMKIKSNHKYTIEYKKGLGSLNPKEYEQFFTLRPFEECLVELDYTDSDLQLMVKWLEDDADFRKERIQYRIKEFDIGNI